MNIFFSGSNLSFYDGSMKQDYVTAGTWPDDAIEMTDKERGTYWMQRAPDGKVLGSKKGRPAWVDTPKPTNEELITLAESRKQSLIAEVTIAIAPLQDAVDLGIVTKKEESALKEWKTYRVMLNRVDTSLGADVVWPMPPA